MFATARSVAAQCNVRLGGKPKAAQTTKKGMGAMTPEQVRSLSTPELIALYNRLTGKSIKRFSSRSNGEAQTLKALAANPPKPPPTARTVNGSASSGRSGRPKAQFIVQLTEARAKSKPTAKSDRMALIEWLRARTGTITVNTEELANAAHINDIEAHFQKRMRGVTQKLIEKGWLRRVEVEVAP